MAPFLYRFTPLHTLPNSIRLVTLFPAPHKSADLHCIIVAASLDARPTYEALSYTWGKDGKWLPLNLNGARLFITSNLDSALRHLRLHDKVRTLWIDAICINQGDVAERNQQVQRMRLIYEKAEQVLVWLGEEKDNSNLAMQSMRTIAEDIGLDILDTDNPAMEWMPKPDGRSLEAQASQPGPSMLVKEMVDADPEIFSAVLSLLIREWWQRAWVLQETAVARKVLVICGDAALSWTHVLIASYPIRFIAQLQGGRLWDNKSRNLRDVLQGTSATMDFIGRRWRKRTNALKILDLLFFQRMMQATEPKDKIYALLGLAQDKFLAGYTPDYSQSDQDVFCEFTRLLITNTDNLDVLKFCQTIKLTEGLPSWVPDWRALLCEPLNYNIDDATFHFADGGNKSWFQFSKDLKGLIVGAVLFDTVSDISHRAYSENLIDTATFARKCIAPYVSFAEPLHERYTDGIYKDSEAVKNAIWRTLIADRSFDAGIAGFNPPRAEQTVGEDFDALCQLAAAEDDIMPRLKRQFPLREHGMDLYVSAFTRAIPYRRLFISENGYLGLGSEFSEHGDTLCIIRGASVPFLLRKKEQVVGELETYELISECYVHGAMDGEIIEEMKTEKQDERSRFILIR